MINVESFFNKYLCIQYNQKWASQLEANFYKWQAYFVMEVALQ